jgi:hypothetical protein
MPLSTIFQFYLRIHFPLFIFVKDLSLKKKYVGMTNMLSILIKNIHKWWNMVDDKGLRIPYTHPTFSCSCTDIDNFFFMKWTME